MSLGEDLANDVASIFREQWTTRDGQVIPTTADLKLSNSSVKLKGTVLYADLAQSTALVNEHKAEFAAEVYKAYLHCACRIIRADGGEVTAFDGDRVMAVYIGDNKNSSAARSALKINHAVQKIINPKLKKQYPGTSYEIRQAIGVDVSDLWVARTGIRGSNDLVWVGRAANYAAKLCSLRQGNYTTWITKDVYDCLSKDVRYGTGDKNVWEERTWTSQQGITVYSSSWTWRI